MPKRGWKSITVKDEVYNYFYAQYLKDKEEFRLKHGITSFSGYISKKLYELIQQEKTHNPQ